MNSAIQAVSVSNPQTFAQLLFSLEGRISRSTYWLKYTLPVAGVAIVLRILDILLGTMSANGTVGLLGAIFSLILIWPGIAVMAKRLHDRNRSGWFILISVIPIIGWIWLFIEVGCLKGTEGPNRFGPDSLVG